MPCRICSSPRSGRVLVWSAHALIVMLEWCYTIDLLGSASALGVGTASAGHAGRADPAVAGERARDRVGTHRIQRPRSSPGGTDARRGAGDARDDGGGLVDHLRPGRARSARSGAGPTQTSLGTLAVASGGAPSGAGRELAESMGVLFAAAIEAPVVLPGVRRRRVVPRPLAAGRTVAPRWPEDRRWGAVARWLWRRRSVGVCAGIEPPGRSPAAQCAAAASGEQQRRARARAARRMDRRETRSTIRARC